MRLSAKIVSLFTRDLSRILSLSLLPEGVERVSLFSFLSTSEQVTYTAPRGLLSLHGPVALEPRSLGVWKGWGEVKVEGDNATIKAVGEGGTAGTPRQRKEAYDPFVWLGRPVRSTVHAPTLLAALKAINPVVGDPSRFCVWLDNGEALATDGHKAKTVPSGVGELPSGGVAVPVSTAKRWQAALTALAKSGGGWSVETAEKRVALVWRREGEELRIEAAPHDSRVTPSTIRNVLKPTDDTLAVVVDSWALYDAAKTCGGEVWIFSNGAVLALDEKPHVHPETPTMPASEYRQYALSGLLPPHEAPIGGFGWGVLKAALPATAKRQRPERLTLLIGRSKEYSTLQIEGVDGLVMGLRHSAYQAPADLGADDFEPMTYAAAAE